MSNNKIISIIIPSLNEEKYIVRCLESICTQEIQDISIEVIVVDNGSTDRTRELAKSFSNRLNIQVFLLEHVNVASLRNKGVQASNGPIIAFLDADCTVAPTWLVSALPYLNTENDIAAVGCSHLTPADFGWVAKNWDLVVAKNRKTGEVKQLPSGNMIVERSKFNSVDGFNEKLTTNEDFDLCYRLRDQGYKIVADKRIKAYHWGTPDSIHVFYKQARWHGRHVYKVFLSDLKKRHNLKAVSYGVYYFIIQMLLLFFFIFPMITFGWCALIFVLIIIVFPPFYLSYNVMKKNNKFIHIVQLATLYLVYGIARSHSIIDAIRKK